MIANQTIKQMTPEEINAVIAETHGWSHYGCTGCAMSPCVCNEWIHAESNGPTNEPPNYYGSLDAIVPVVREMDDNEMGRVVLELNRISMSGPLFSCYVATPAQWCEAYLKAKRLWKS